jgi:hypothetical protein
MLTIDYRGPSQDPDLRIYAEQRLLSWIGDVGRAVPAVTVCLDRWTEGGKPRVRCRMVARPLRWATVAVAKTDADPYAAIDSCAELLASHLALTRKADLATRWRGLDGKGAAVSSRSSNTSGTAR